MRLPMWLAVWACCLSVSSLTLLPQMALGGQRGGLDRYLVVGDSLEVGAGPYLERRGARVNARGGRPSTEGVQVLRQLLKPRHKGVVFDLGTNDATVGELKRSLRQAKRMVGGRDLYVATVNSPWQQREKNQLLRRFAQRNPNVHLVNWAEKGRTGSDGIHSTPEGYRQRARMIARAVRTSPEPPAPRAEQPLSGAVSPSGGLGALAAALTSSAAPSASVGSYAPTAEIAQGEAWKRPRVSLYDLLATRV